MAWGFSRAALVGTLSGVLVATALAAAGSGADAKSTYESPYGYDRTWNAALRLVRVDNGWKITEKDETNGYLLFEYSVARAAARRPRGRWSSCGGATPTTAVSVLVQLPADAALPRAGPPRRAGVEDAPRVRRPAAAAARPTPVAPPDAGARRPADRADRGAHSRSASGASPRRRRARGPRRSSGSRSGSSGTSRRAPSSSAGSACGRGPSSRP